MITILMALSALYVSAIVGLILLLRRIGTPGRWAIAAAFFIFGAATGLLTAWAWPLDSAAYCNVYAMLLGDQLYVSAINYLGNPHSANAHNTIPWLLRVPQIYVPAALIPSGLLGLLLQWGYNRRARTP